MTFQAAIQAAVEFSKQLAAALGTTRSITVSGDAQIIAFSNEFFRLRDLMDASTKVYWDIVKLTMDLILGQKRSPTGNGSTAYDRARYWIKKVAADPKLQVNAVSWQNPAYSSMALQIVDIIQAKYSELGDYDFRNHHFEKYLTVFAGTMEALGVTGISEAVGVGSEPDAMPAEPAGTGTTEETGGDAVPAKKFPWWILVGLLLS
jgi:hypothetical protein